MGVCPIVVEKQFIASLRFLVEVVVALAEVVVALAEAVVALAEGVIVLIEAVVLLVEDVIDLVEVVVLLREVVILLAEGVVVLRETVVGLTEVVVGCCCGSYPSLGRLPLVAQAFGPCRGFLLKGSQPSAGLSAGGGVFSLLRLKRLRISST